MKGSLLLNLPSASRSPSPFPPESSLVPGGTWNRGLASLFWCLCVRFHNLCDHAGKSHQMKTNGWDGPAQREQAIHHRVSGLPVRQTGGALRLFFEACGGQRSLCVIVSSLLHSLSSAAGAFEGRGRLYIATLGHGPLLSKRALKSEAGRGPAKAFQEWCLQLYSVGCGP